CANSVIAAAGIDYW
nr:immunoglobulin heavy chain junction region [Macaca mulatta]